MKKMSNEEVVEFYKKLPTPSAVVQFVLAILVQIYCGFAVKMLWNWFVVPLGLPSITLVHAIGLDVLITFLVTTRVPTTYIYWYQTISAVLLSSVALLSGLILQVLM